MPYPLLYEINTRCWLRDLSQELGRAVTLADIPEKEFHDWQRLGFTHIWLMGVWTGGLRSRAQALQVEDLRRAYSEALPDWTEKDVGGSPYAIAGYQVDPQFGGEKALVAFRRNLQDTGLKLMLDFVPNHLGLDHPWLAERPQLFVHLPEPGPDALTLRTPAGQVNLAYGKDPYCSPWTDTVQLDYRRAETRAAMQTLLANVSELCDGVRCDMAMLVLNDVFARTWERSPSNETAHPNEFWSDAISAVRKQHPEFEFLAEVYWGIEDRLQALGFNYTYDKVLYDELVARNAAAVQRHLLGLSPQRLAASAHFLENHDERRIASLLDFPQHRAAALVILGLPGMRFLHEGQLLGFRRRLPVQLVRRTRETTDADIKTLYEDLLIRLQGSAVGQGKADLLQPRSAWDGNPTAQNFVLVQWTLGETSFDLVVVNLAPHQGQCYAPVRLPGHSPASWSMTDVLGKEKYIRNTDELRSQGLYLDVGARVGQIFHFEPVAA
ncbi:MAG TPA: alpha-amylase family glycosyl hydrolase [Patescibacteria group bacterium]|nr:alpha-amylase family glycosyl hydrolase [Patescibacteria group bacterium]